MSKKMHKETFDYAAVFDRAMNSAFEGEGFATTWSILAGQFGGYVTTRANGKPLTALHGRVGRAISDAIAEARP